MGMWAELFLEAELEESIARAAEEHELPFCGYCGEPCRKPHIVEWDGMVDGPGCLMSEERCEHCDPDLP